MAETAKLDLILRAFAVFNGFDGPEGTLWWRVDDKYAPVTLLVNCNDLFLWGCADCEQLDEDSIGKLEETFAELKALGKGEYADILWCCRQRGNRPQRPYFKHIPDELHKLFKAAGPEIRA